jgi:hypothetical protein
MLCLMMVTVRSRARAGGVGHKPCNTGALLFLSIADRAMYISKGSGMDDVLTHTRLSHVLTAMKEPLREVCVLPLSIPLLRFLMFLSLA